MYVGLPTRGVHGKHCDILFVHRLKVPGVNGHHLDGAPSLGRHKDFSRYPVISREGKTLDYLFVCDDSIISRWQHTTHILQMERSMKCNYVAACPYCHRIRPWVDVCVHKSLASHSNRDIHGARHLQVVSSLKKAGVGPIGQRESNEN